MTQHTPGPWHYVVDPEGKFGIYPEGRKFLAITDHEANARLIAAAPAMKGQLQTAIDVIEVAIQLFIRKEDSEAFAALKGIIAGNEMAIAKAEGP